MSAILASSIRNWPWADAAPGASASRASNASHDALERRMIGALIIGALVRCYSVFTAGKGGVVLGARRCLVACSYAYASLIIVGSLYGRPKKVTPTGSPEGVNP